MIKKMMSMMVALTLLAGSMALPAFADTATPNNNPHVIAVTGSGKVIAKPDIAYLQVGYQAQDKVALVAQNEAKANMAEIIKQLKAAGVKNTDIKTTNISLYKTADYVKEVKTEYYVAINTVEVTTRDLDKIGSLIDTAVNAGANELGSVRFTVEDEEKYQIQAITLALKNAGNKAKAIASFSGLTINKPSKITENNYGGGVIYREASAMAKSADVATPVEIGTITIDANISVEYQY